MPVPPSPIAFDFGFWQLRWYSIFVTSAIAIALILGLKLVQQKNLNSDFLLDCMLWVIPMGIIGARAYYVLFHWDYYGQHIDQIIQIWSGGIAIHGAIFLGVFTAWLYAKVKKEKLLPYMDIAMPCLALAQAIGRWGNYFNQEAYGAETSLPWGMIINGVSYHPAFLYESIWDIVLFFLLYHILQKKEYPTGFVTALYAFGYSLGRLWIEELRLDSEWIGPLKAASVWSVLGIVISAFFIYRAVIIKKKRS